MHQTWKPKKMAFLNQIWKSQNIWHVTTETVKQNKLELSINLKLSKLHYIYMLKLCCEISSCHKNNEQVTQTCQKIASVL